MKKQNHLNSLARYFKINRCNNCIDLSDSYSMCNNKMSKILFQSEIFKVTFKTIKESYNLFLSANELICNDCINYLKKNLGIEIFGDGSFFEVLNYTQNFEIIFDSENSTFIDTDSVENGVVYFYKK